jgi:hypothetical protein
MLACGAKKLSPMDTSGESLDVALVNNSSAHNSRGSVSLVRIEFVDVGGGELAGGSLLLEQDVEFSVGSTLGFRQTEEDPDGLRGDD